jgi:RNA polymerase sigma-70 factor (ECF subfamily)
MTSAVDREFLPSSDDLVELLGLVAEYKDIQAFAALFRFFAPRLKSYLARQGYSDSECEDLIQETLMNVWRKADSFDRNRAGVSTWIFTIARNLGIDRRRREARATIPRLADAVEEVDPDPSAEHQIILREDEARIREALRHLPAEQAEVIRLSFYSENPQSEIARSLGIPLGTVKSRVRLALQRLRQLIDRKSVV